MLAVIQARLKALTSHRLSVGRRRNANVAVLDIGDQGTAIAALECDKASHLTFKAVDYFNGPVDDIVESLQPFIQKHQLEGGSCAIVLPPNQYRLFFIDAPKLPQAEWREAMPWLCKDFVYGSVDDVAIDAFPVPMNSASQQAKAYAVITEKKTLLHLQSIATKLRLHVQSISITEFAMQQVLEEVADTQSAAILFDGLILMIVDKGNIHMVRRLNGATDEDVGDEFTLEMERSLDFYQSEIHNALPEKLYLTPQKAKIKGLTALLQEKMLMPIEVIDVSKLLPGALRENQDISNCVACIGEALRVIKMGLFKAPGEGSDEATS